jgi:hypothetical protein
MIQRWTKLLKPENFDVRLREQQNEERLIYDKLDMTSIEPPSDQKSQILSSPDKQDHMADSKSPIFQNTTTSSIYTEDDEDYEYF